MKTVAGQSADVSYDGKITRADFTKGIGGPIDPLKGFIMSENRPVSTKNYQRKTIGGSTGREAKEKKRHEKSKSTGGSIGNMTHFRNTHTRGPSVDLSAQLTTRRMYGNTLSRATTMTWNDNLEKLQKEFPVLPYYKDESKTTIAIPQNLQVKESVLTLRYQSTKEGNEPSENTDDDCPLELERYFVQQRFYKSRRLVRISLASLMVFILVSAITDDCDIMKNMSGVQSSELLCTEDEEDMKKRRIIFCFIQCPILIIWLWATFSKVYLENLTWLPSVFVFTIAGFMMLATVIGGTPDSAIYMIYLFIVWLFIRIPFWSALLVTSIMVVIYVVVILVTDLYASLEEELVEILYLFTTNVCLMYAAHFWERSDRVEYLESKILNHVKGNSKNLINQILPIAVQERIQKAFLTKKSDVDQKPIADEANDVSVLFSDIKGFTKFCSSVQAVDVVRALNKLYMTFDDSLEELGVFKVETIGDAYFVSANCPIEAPDHAKRLVILGKEMIKACTEFTPCGAKSKEYKFQMRIGVHSGKVCAGIVGRKMPRYHLFGQTVTIAECMESSGVPGKVQISDATLKYLQDWEKESGEELDFTFEPRGEREVIPSKLMTTYLVKFPQSVAA